MAMLLICCLLTAFLPSAFAETAQREDRLSVTHHTTEIQGKEIAYTVTAGTMAMSTSLGDYDLFFTAYTLDGVEDPAARPITFAYNGGPGVAAAFVNLGLMGPDNILLDADGMITQVPTGYGPNPYSLLDLTDLVFIDPVGTGYSRAAGGTDPKVFYSYPTDNQSVGDFILQYINRNQRWASPKYLAGESYGTVRTAGVCDYLMQMGYMNLNGLMMISSANNFGSVEFTDGNDLPYATYLPTCAAIAHYHGKAAQTYLDMELEDFLDEVRTFAGGEYEGPSAWNSNEVVKYVQDSTTVKAISYGWTDLTNPGCGSDSSEYTTTVPLTAGEFYDYTVYMLPTVYTVQPGHHLKLILTTWDPYRAFLDESFEKLDVNKNADAIDYDYSYIIDNQSIRVRIPVAANQSGSAENP